MNSLPAELLCHIATFSDRETALRLRSVDQTLSDVFTPLAFEHICVGWQTRHLHHLEHLAESPLGKHVRRLTVNTEMLPQLEREDWVYYILFTNLTMLQTDDGDGPDWCYNVLNQAQIWNLLLSKIPEPDLEADFKRFHELAEEQDAKGALMGERFARLIQKFPRVRHFELVDRRGMYDWHEEYFRSDFTFELVEACSPWKDFLIDPTNYWLRLQSERGYWRRHDVNASFAYPIFQMAKAFADGWHPNGAGPCRISAISELTVDIGHFLPHEQPTNEAWQTLERIQDFLYPFLKTLDRLNLSHNLNQLDLDGFIGAEIFYGLQSATNLRHLEIDLRERPGEGHRVPPIYGEKLFWPRLEHFRFSGRISKHDLMQILGSHAKSLRVLELIDVSIEDHPRWDDIIQTLQRILRLDRACVRSLMIPSRCRQWRRYLPDRAFNTEKPKSKVNHQQVEDFLMRKSEELPPQERWERSPSGWQRDPVASTLVETDSDGEEVDV